MTATNSINRQKRCLLKPLRHSGLVLWLLLSPLFFGAVNVARAETATLAVASNFTAAAKALKQSFEDTHPHRVRLSFGSTGKLFTQIANGAPFDVFLSADDQRPSQLAELGCALKDSEFTYALGKLALYSRDASLQPISEKTLLNPAQITRLSLANPKIAPYGAAAMEVLEHLNALTGLNDKLVLGDNIAQTYQFVYTGNANVGFVALAQVRLQANAIYWLVPDDYYAPLKQNAIVLTRAQNNAAARAFMAFLQSSEAINIIRQFGYGLST